jgi:hypothetical protein
MIEAGYNHLFSSPGQKKENFPKKKKAHAGLAHIAKKNKKNPNK